MKASSTYINHCFESSFPFVFWHILYALDLSTRDSWKQKYESVHS